MPVPWSKCSVIPTKNKLELCVHAYTYIYRYRIEVTILDYRNPRQDSSNCSEMRIPPKNLHHYTIAYHLLTVKCSFKGNTEAASHLANYEDLLSLTIVASPYDNAELFRNIRERRTHWLQWVSKTISAAAAPPYLPTCALSVVQRYLAMLSGGAAQGH